MDTCALELNCYHLPARLPNLPRDVNAALKLLSADPVDYLQISKILNANDFLCQYLYDSARDKSIGGVTGFKDLRTVLCLLGAKKLHNILVFYGILLATVHYPQARRYYLSVLIEAYLSEQIASEYHLSDPSVLFTAALMRPMGRLLLSVYAPKVHKDIMDYSRAFATSYAEAAIVFGVNDPALSAGVALRWGFSSQVTSVVGSRYSHQFIMTDLNLLVSFLAAQLISLDKSLQCVGDHNDPLVGQTGRILARLGVKKGDSDRFYEFSARARVDAERLLSYFVS
jgi:hypothetical protein